MVPPRKPRRSPRSEGRSRPERAPRQPRVQARVRRDPAEAREVILAAAEKVLGERGPDAATLKDVARTAGVSHALVTHYFGTYGALVGETLARRLLALRNAVTQELIAAPSDEGPRTVLRRVARALMEPSTLRLVAWALLSGRVDARDFEPAKVQGLRTAADVLEARWRASSGKSAPPRGDIEFAVLATVAILHGYAFGRTAFQTALGRSPGAEADAEFVDRVADMIDAYLHRPRVSPR